MFPPQAVIPSEADEGGVVRNLQLYQAFTKKICIQIRVAPGVIHIQPLQGCNIQFIVNRGFTPTVIQIVPLRGTIYIEIKRISSIRNYKMKDM
jgi:hypothetical protein